MSYDEKSRELRKQLYAKLTSAAELIDAGEYDKFEKMDFSDIEKMSADDIGIKPSEWPFKLMDEVKTLSGLNYMVEKGLIGDEYFKHRSVWEASPEQLDYYIKSGAKINTIRETYSLHNDCKQEESFLDFIMKNDSYSAEHVDSVIKAGGIPRLGYFDVFSFTEWLKRIPGEEKDFYNVHDVNFGIPFGALIRKERVSQQNLEDKIRVLNNAGYLEKYDRELLMRFPFSDSLQDDLRHSDSPELDPLEIKLKRLKASVGDRLGKTGDSTTGEQKNLLAAKKQTEMAKKVMMVKRYKDGKYNK